MKSRLLILTFTYPPNQDGVANAAALLAEGLAGRGHQVVVGTLWHPERGAPRPGDNPQVHQFHVEGSASWRDRVRGETDEMKRFISSFRDEIVFCHTLETAPTVLALQKFHQMPGPKVLVSHGFPLHMVPWHSRFPWGLGQWLGWQPLVWRLPWLLKSFDRLVFLSEQRDFGRFFDQRVASVFRHRGIRVIPNGVDWGAAQPSVPAFRQIYGLSGRLLFLCVANYCDRKNQLLALRAYRRARIPVSALVFIGSELNDYSHQMQELDRRLALDFPEGRVIILEKLARSMTEGAFHTMDAFVLSAKHETQPIVLLETMAACKPFLSTNTGCVRHLAGGIVVRTEAEMTRQMQRLAAEPALRASLGSAGHREYLAKYRKEAVLDAYEKLIEELRKGR